jgi:hypothetical protein
VIEKIIDKRGPQHHPLTAPQRPEQVEPAPQSESPKPTGAPSSETGPVEQK